MIAIVVAVAVEAVNDVDVGVQRYQIQLKEGPKAALSLFKERGTYHVI